MRKSEFSDWTNVEQFRLERLRAMYSDARQLSSTVGRQSLEFGESSLSTVREARSRMRRHPVASLALVSLCVSLLLRFLRRRGAGRDGRLRDLFRSTATEAEAPQ